MVGLGEIVPADVDLPLVAQVGPDAAGMDLAGGALEVVGQIGD